MNIEYKRKAINTFVEEHCKGKMFSVSFIKKTTGEPREMTCKSGVFKHSKGGDNPVDHCPDLMSTYDMNIANKLPEEQRAKAYRCIHLDGVTHIKCGSHEINF